MRFAKIGAAATLAMALAGQAQAGYFFDTVGDSILTNYSTTQDGATLSATIKYELVQIIDSDSVRFTVTVNNYSSGQGLNRIVSFGVGVINPDLASATDSRADWDTNLNASITNTNVDFCAISGGDSSNNCSGGGGPGQGSVAMGATLVMDVTMNFVSAIPATGVEFDTPFRIRWQSIGTTGGSLGFNGCVDGTPGCDRPPQELPEPGALALASLALLGVGLARRRRSA